MEPEKRTNRIMGSMRPYHSAFFVSVSACVSLLNLSLFTAERAGESERRDGETEQKYKTCCMF